MHTICVKLIVVCSCVQKDPVSRLSVTQIAQLPFVQDFVTNQLPGMLKAQQLGVHCFDFLRTLGRGSSGTAELVRRKSDNTLLVIKVIQVV